MTTLYECLREARLDHFYPAFRANGITRSETLITLGMAEFCALGITTAEDKRRLVELINIVKSVHRTSHASSPTVQRQTNRFRPSINASPSSALIDSSQTPVRGINQTKSRNISNNRSSNYLGILNTPVRLEPSRNVVVQDRIPNFSVSSYMDMLQYMSDQSESSGEESDVAKPFVPVANRKTSSPSLGRSSVSKWPNVERVKHSKSKGYNYGVHKINTPTKSKAKSGAQRHTADEKIKVCVRKRPLTKRELKAREEDIVNVESTNTLAVNEPKLAVDLKAYTLQHEFMFDEVFDETCTNEDVYIRAARPLINCVFNGGTATCFAYGQTGAGKTHTMLGNVNTPGLYLLAGQDIFNIIQSEKYGKDLHVWVSFFEIYCGQLFDLLNKRNRLHAREDGSHQVCIAGLTETEATSVTSLVQILEYGNSVRSKGATGVNPDSSRSHAILQLDIRNGEDIKIGKISFIDLAGSERASDVTDTDKQTRMEGAEINQSLLALKECIRSIDQESRHTPFRQSKLTHILKDSFVGNSRTCMIANISPTQSSCENTINTLRYADRVKELKREGVRSSSVGQAMNLLMNIPPTAPSVFHPSNILSTSTPQRQTTHSRRDRMTDIVIDPSETPIRGHNMPRWTPVKDGSKNRNVTSPSPNTMSRHEKSTSSAPVVPPGSSARFSTHATAASQGASAPPPDASPSESDVTDTDSCNVTHPINNKYSISNRPVAKSSDTEFEFSTSDFNDLNDLNRTGENQAILSQPPPQLPQKTKQYLPHPSMETVISGIIRAPAVKPVVYKSMDPGAEIVAENSTNSPGYFPLASNVSQNFTPSLTKAIKLTELEEAERDYKKSLIQELMRSSDDSIDDEVLLAEDTNSEIPELQNQNVASITPTVGIRNNNVMIPLPAESSDLTKFTQRIPFKAFEMKPTGLNDLTSKPISLIPQQQDIPLPSTPISLTNHNRPGSAQSKSPAPNTGSTAIDATNIFTQQEQIPVRQLPRPKTKTPNSEPNIIPPYPVQQISKSPQMTTVDYDMDQSPRLQHHSDPSEFRFRSTISQSPTGEHSDDSTDSIRQSFSDQGQGGYRHFKDREVVNMRKEKSDPMLALDMQRKKQTLPDPQNFSKILTRSNTPKSVRTNKEASLKVSHNDIVSMKPSLVEKQESNENNMGGQSSHISPRSEQTIDLEKDNLKKQVEDTRPKGKQLPQVPFLRQDVPSKSNSVIVTEKLMAGAVFSPIHPQPVTNMEKKLHADSITTPSATVQGSPAPSTENTAANSGGEHSQALQDERIRLITSHEDQLATVTQLCKNEMRLLLNAKKISGKRGFDEYVRRVDDILQQKMNVIASLHEEISLYITNNTQSHSVLSSVAVSTSSINSASSSHISHLQFVSTNR
uniref:Kinesin motor domain-containing protein n=1 Tax=Biomphalaria glabrata TaxID=6526 RepID=A0A2C9JU95_BIOGL